MPHRNQDQNRWDEQARRDRVGEDDINWTDRDRSRDESRSWAGDRDAPRSQAYRQPGGGQYARDEDSRGYGRDRDDWGAPSSQDRYGYGAGPYQPSRSYGGETWARGRGGFEQQPRAGEFGRDYGVNRAYGAYQSREQEDARAYRATSHAPGAQIWEASGSDNRRDYEPDYLHWREQQISKFDRDYDDWRSERRQKFSSDFDTWRTNRADNPIVGDVADGGVGSQKDLKKD